MHRCAVMRDPVNEAFERLFGPEFGHGKAFDLARLGKALCKLGAPQNTLAPIIHVAGTNGKGSTIAFMRAIAEAAGLRVHAFTKPHLLVLNERFCLAGAPASEAALIAAAARVAGADAALTHFDAQIAAAFVLFSETPADLVLLETGMGGREDSTNVIAAPALVTITPIGLDHQDALGDTLAAIGAHKAGILKPGAPAVIARQAPEAMAVIQARADEIGARLFRAGVEWDAYRSHGRLVVQTKMRALDLPLPAMAGGHQIDNAGLACATLLTWREISDDAFARGVANANWPARLQPLTRGSFSAPIRALGGEVWIDGGHNAHAAAALARAMAAMKARRGGTNIAIVGLRARKDARAFTAALRTGVDHIIAIPLHEAHAPLSAISATQASTLAFAMQSAAQFPAPRLLICGSFLLAAEALAAESA